MFVKARWNQRKSSLMQVVASENKNTTLDLPALSAKIMAQIFRVCILSECIITPNTCANSATTQTNLLKYSQFWNHSLLLVVIYGMSSTISCGVLPLPGVPINYPHFLLVKLWTYWSKSHWFQWGQDCTHSTLSFRHLRKHCNSLRY